MTALLAAWPKGGLCTGQPEAMADPEQAEATCHRCPALHACKEWVLSIPLHLGPTGVVAAMTLTERERIVLGQLPPRHCDDCKQTKPLYEFAQNAAGKPGRRLSCRTCMNRRSHRRPKEGAR